MTIPQFDQHYEEALMAQFVRLDFLPTQAKPRDPMAHEPHPVTDGMEKEE